MKHLELHLKQKKSAEGINVYVCCIVFNKALKCCFSIEIAWKKCKCNFVLINVILFFLLLSHITTPLLYSTSPDLPQNEILSFTLIVIMFFLFFSLARNAISHCKSVPQATENGAIIHGVWEWVQMYIYIYC